MAEHDPQAFQVLFAAEPQSGPSSEVEDWMTLYRRLVAVLERQLDETQRFAAEAPEAMRE
jgi:broad specificity phosphatase PhoE